MIDGIEIEASIGIPEWLRKKMFPEEEYEDADANDESENRDDDESQECPIDKLTRFMVKHQDFWNALVALQNAAEADGVDCTLHIDIDDAMGSSHRG